MRYIDKVAKAHKYINDLYHSYAGLECAVACSFGKDSMVVLHMALQVDPKFPVFAVMTPFKPQETFDYMEYIIHRWDLNIKVYRKTLDILHTGLGETLPLWQSNPDGCCEYYKVEPTRRAIADMGLDVWFTGLRKTEGRTRTDYQYEESEYPLMKCNPILEFTELDVWRYLATNNIPVNPLYKKGYRSLGCQQCSQPEEDETDLERGGRWKGTSKCGGECGIHTKNMKEVVK